MEASVFPLRVPSSAVFGHRLAATPPTDRLPAQPTIHLRQKRSEKGLGLASGSPASGRPQKSEISDGLRESSALPNGSPLASAE